MSEGNDVTAADMRAARHVVDSFDIRDICYLRAGMPDLLACAIADAIKAARRKERERCALVCAAHAAIRDEAALLASYNGNGRDEEIHSAKSAAHRLDEDAIRALEETR